MSTVQVMTSFHPEGVEDHLLVIASTNLPQAEGMPSRLQIRIPRSKAYFTGTGRYLSSSPPSNQQEHHSAGCYTQHQY